MKKYLSLPIVAALAAQAHAGSDAVAPDQPVFVPPAVVFIPPTFRAPQAVPSTGDDATSGVGPDAGASAAPAGLAGAGAGPGTAEAEAEAIARRISSQIAEAQLFCARVSFAEYRIDCLSDQLDQVAATVPSTPDFEDARGILRDTSDKLAALARANRSTSRRPANLTSTTTDQASGRPIVAVGTANLPAAAARAETIIDEATTLLLRAGETSERRKVVYETISEAIGSTKLLLRSS